MLAKLAQVFDRVMRKYTPDPYIFALLLTFVVLILGIAINGQSPAVMVQYWGEGFWSLIPFTLQMVMILVTGFIVAHSRPVRALLNFIASKAKTPGGAIVLTSIITTICCWLNWGFGLVVGAFLCRAMVKAVPNVNYKVLVASAYGGFIVWHGGLSGSIPLLLATADNFSLPLVGRIIPLSETLWTWTNMTASIGLLIILPITNYFMSKSNVIHDNSQYIEDDDHVQKAIPKTPAEKLENSSTITVFSVLLGAIYIFILFFTDSFHFDINQLNFIFLFVGIALHGRIRNFLDAANEAAKKIAPLLIQYPFYAGIMGMMQHSGLAESISQLFVAISTETTFPLFTFYSAGIVNFFVPSGGGQWAVQSPIVVPAAVEIGASLSKSVLAVAWGDAWTNMAQPFWALPLLAVAGLKIRDIMGYCVTILIVSGIFLSLVFLLT